MKKRKKKNTHTFVVKWYNLVLLLVMGQRALMM